MTFLPLFPRIVLVGLLANPAAGEQPPAKPQEPVVVAPKAPVDPSVQKAVDSMQKFYEDTKDFQADFHQIYTRKVFASKSEAWGTMKFRKEGPSMRWDYKRPDEKVFVITGEKVITYDKAAKQATVSRLSADRLSASITFLWGQGKLDREFRITKAERKDLKDGIALELVPKVADPRFQKIFFLLDPKTYAVKETIVADPDGSENRMVFSNPKANTGFGDDAFKINPPEGTQIIRLDQ